MAALSLRIDFEPGGRIGPGKIELLERIASCGSISAAARAMDMGYAHAWTLIEEIEAVFGKPVLLRKSGGKLGGGSSLNGFGETLVSRYREIERSASDAADDLLKTLQFEIQPNSPGSAP